MKPGNRSTVKRFNYKRLIIKSAIVSKSRERERESNLVFTDSHNVLTGLTA